MDHGLINDIAVCIVMAWVLAVVAQLFRQPLILAYLVAGFAVGPNAVGFVADQDSIQTISELGLILLLFMIGLEIDLKKMLGAGKAITFTSGLQILGGTFFGILVFMMCGFPLRPGQMDSLYLGVATALSSTVIVVKLLYDKRELDTLPGRLTLGVLVLQDLFAILFLAVQPNLGDPRVSLVLSSFVKVAVLVFVAFAASRFALPPLFRAVARLPELVLVGALAWCFLVAGLASVLGLSREMGALVAGVAISTFPYTLDVTAKVTSLRDFFVTLFFVALGMKIPLPSASDLGWAAVVAGYLVMSRLATVFPPLHGLKLGHRASILPAVYLAQLSELSLVILTLGVDAGHIAKRTADVGIFAFVFLAVASTYATTRSDSWLNHVRPWLTRLGFRDLDHETAVVKRSGEHPRIFLLGFSWTASSLLEEIVRHDPNVLADMCVLDFNPLVNQRLRERGVKVIYGDITQRDTLLHAGVHEAELLVCTLPNTVLKGASNMKLLQTLRELNPHARIIVHAELIEDAAKLYAAGASFVHLPRLLEAREFLELIEAARNNLLDEKRAAQAAELPNRREVIP